MQKKKLISIYILSNVMNISKSLRFILILLVTFGFQSSMKAQLYELYHHPSGIDTLWVNKSIILVYFDTTAPYNKVKKDIDSCRYCDSLQISDAISEDTSSRAYYVRLKTGITDANYLNALKFFQDTLVIALNGTRVFGPKKEVGETNIILVKLYNWSDSSSLKTYCTTFGHLFMGRWKGSDEKICLVKTSGFNNSFTFVNYLISTGLFAYAEPNLLFFNIQTTPNDPLYYQSWHLKNTGSNNYYNINGTSGADINVESAWALGTTGMCNRIAILDDGVWAPHEDLLTYGNGFNALRYDPYYQPQYIMGMYTRRYLIDNGMPEKNNRIWNTHGTSSAGIAAAKANNSKGSAGVAPDAMIFGIKMIHEGTTSTLALAAAYKLAIDSAEADIISGSFAFAFPGSIFHGTFDSYIIDAAINYVVMNGRNGLGTPIFHSTGNGFSTAGIPCNTTVIGYPASNTNTIAVTGTNMCDQLKASGDCTGTTGCTVASHGSGTDIAAPYYAIWTTRSPRLSPPDPGSTYYRLFGGTSASCPMAAGVMGLIFSANPFLNLSQARYVIESTTDKVGGYTYSSGISGQPNGTWSSELGYGRVDAEQAVVKAMTTNVNLMISNAPFLVDVSEGTIFKNDFTMYPIMHLFFLANDAAYGTYDVNWYRDGILISTVNNTYLDLTKPGKYYATIENNCNNQVLLRTEEIEIRPTCTGAFYNNTYSSPAGYTFTGVTTFSTISNIEPVPINGDLVIGAGATVNVSNRQFIFSNCAKLIVQAGGTLNASNCQFIGCDDWQGIICDGASSSVSITSSYIANATAGIISKNGGALNISLTTFAYNYLHSAIDNSGSGLFITFLNNTFTELSDIGAGSPPCSNNYYNALGISTQQPKIFVLNSMSGLVNGNIFQISNSYANNNVKCLVSTSSDNLTFNNNSVLGMYDNVLSVTTGANITIDGNDFENYYPGIVPTDPIDENCMYFKDVKGSSIYDNEVKLYKYGCQFIQNLMAAPLTTMEQNKFRQCNVGVVYGSIVNPIGAGSGSSNLPCSTKFAIQLGMKCNIFTGNKYGVVGSGPLINQGTGTTSAGNRFQNGGAPLNIEHSFLGTNCGIPINYYYYSGIGIDDNPVSNNNTAIPDVDGYSLSNGSIYNDFAPAGVANSLSCTNLLTFTVSTNTIQTNLKNIVLYPNPSSQFINFNGIKSDVKLKIMSIDGKVLKEIILSGQNLQVNILDLSNGIYIFVLEDGISTSQYKVIKAAE